MNPAITEKADLTGLYLLTLLQLWSFFFQVIPYSCSVHDMTILHDKMIFKSLLEHFSINTKAFIREHVGQQVPVYRYPH